MEQYDNYVKQTYRNRCVIAAADGPLALTIPTEKSGTPKCLMKDVRISDHGNWRHTVPHRPSHRQTVLYNIPPGPDRPNLNISYSPLLHSLKNAPFSG